jgi:hypothetical protein
MGSRQFLSLIRFGFDMLRSGTQAASLRLSSLSAVTHLGALHLTCSLQDLNWPISVYTHCIGLVRMENYLFGVTVRLHPPTVVSFGVVNKFDADVFRPAAAHIAPLPLCPSG